MLEVILWGALALVLVGIYVFGAWATWCIFHIDCEAKYWSTKENIIAGLISVTWPVAVPLFIFTAIVS